MTENRAAARTIVVGVLVVMVFAMAVVSCGSRASSDPSVTSASGPTTPAPSSTTLAAATTPSKGTATVLATARAPVTITILYDNTATYPGTRADWGFSCLIEGPEKTVLFDTGNDGDILLDNLDTLQIEPEAIDVVVLSHDHQDHTSGLAQLVAVNPGVTVYYPASFSEATVRSAREAGASLVPVNAATSPCPGLLVTSPQGSPGESALLVDTGEGWVLVAGCAHPGIVEMTAAASGLVGEPIYAVLGGFHLMSSSAGQVDRIIQGLRDLGVERCGPAHCTGKAAIAQITAAFAGGAIEMGVGAIISF